MNNRLFDFSPVERKAIERVKDAYRFNKHIGMHDKLLLAFSGGKDSVCLYHVCELASQELGVDFDEAFYCQYNVTNIDPPELVRFIRNEYPKVHFHHPKITFWKLLEKKRMLPTQMVRFCCQELKEISHFEGGYTLTGVRKAESVKRSKRESFEAVESYEEIKRLIAIALGETIVIDSIKSSGGGVAVGVATGNMRIDHGKEPTVTNIKSVETLYC